VVSPDAGEPVAGLPAKTGRMVYEITLRGRAERTIAAAFDEFEVTTEPGLTRLRGEIIDQAALHGVLERIQRLGLTLLEVHAPDVH
jgi:hypothetical protein